MYSITPVGSCRIHTPLRIAAPDYGFFHNTQGIFGFTHSSAEAVQQVRLLQGDYVPSEAVWPLIAPKKDLVEILAQKHEISDLYIVELCSAKRIEIKGEFVQLNYLKRRYRSFFDDDRRTHKFWKLSEIADQQGMDALIAGVAQECCLSDTDMHVLSKLRYSLTTQAELATDIRYLLNALPNVLFVTHVNAKTNYGQIIETRSRYIRLVKDTVKKENGAVFDATALIASVGQENAILDESNSLAHFTPAFSKTVFAAWHTGFIVDLIDKAARQGKFARSLENMLIDLDNQIETGNAVNSLERIKAAIKDLGALPALASIQARAFELLQSQDQAIDALKRSLKANPQNTSLLEQLANVYFGRGEWHSAMGFFSRLRLAGGKPDIATQVSLAEKLSQSDEEEAALGVYNDTYIQAPSCQAAAQGLARLALRLKDQSKIEICQKILKETPQYLDPHLAIHTAIFARYKIDLTPQLNVISSLPIPQFIEVLEVLEQNGHSDSVANAIVQHIKTGSDLSQEPKIAKMIEQWGDEIDGDSIETISAMGNFLRVRPENAGLKKVNDKLRAQVVNTARAYKNDKNIAKLEVLRDQFKRLVPPISEIYSHLGRLYYHEGRFEECIASAQTAIQLGPKNEDAWLFLMRGAYRANMFTTAIHAAKMYPTVAGDNREKQKAEAKLRLAEIPEKSMKKSRSEVDLQKAWQLCEAGLTDPDIADMVQDSFARIERKMEKHIAALSQSDDSDISMFAKQYLEIRPENARILLPFCQYLTKARAYETAIPFWQLLLALRNSDPKILSQLQLCIDRSQTLKNVGALS